MQMYSIGEIARRAGVAVSTIQYYERIRLLPPSKRVNTKRRYDLSILQQLSVIRMAQYAGFTIAEIQTLLHDFPVDTPPSARWQALAGKKIVELNEAMQRMQAMKALLEQTLECHCLTIEDCAKIDENTVNGVLDVNACCGTDVSNVELLPER